jgi:Fe2+ transport system protein FeoA
VVNSCAIAQSGAEPWYRRYRREEAPTGGSAAALPRDGLTEVAPGPRPRFGLVAGVTRPYTPGVGNPDPVTRISPGDRGGGELHLERVPIGRTVRVTGMPDADRPALEQEGVVTGAVLTIERRVGLGGPIIVRLGRARLAIARPVAATVLVETVEKERL